MIYDIGWFLVFSGFKAVFIMSGSHILIDRPL